MIVSFLFGSGADSCINHNLQSGASFSESVICNEYSKEVKQLSELDANEYKIIYPSSSKVFIQTIYQNADKLRSIINNFSDTNKKPSITNDEIDLILNYYNKTKINYNDTIRPICKKIYDIIFDKNEQVSDNNSEIKDFFLANAVFFDSFDEKFNSLRYEKMNLNAKRITNVYYLIFILMINGVYCIDNNFEWNIKNVIKKLKEDYDVKSEQESYYSILKNFKCDYNLITTNYTNYIEQIKDDAIYLHGKLTWFEDTLGLSVYDIKKEEECQRLLNIIEKRESNSEKGIIPFILIPSGVKPIICDKQIEQFSRFIKVLKESNILIVVGYRFNSEDNHINSIIINWLKRKDKQLIYLNYEDSIVLEDQTWIKNSIDVEHDISTSIELIGTDKKIINLSICGNNALDVYKKVLHKIEKI